MKKPLQILLYGRNARDMESSARSLGLKLVDRNPEVVVSYGGDGTLLRSEMEWPGIPKVALRDSKRCNTCSHESNETILRHLAEGRLKRSEFMKLRAEAKGQVLRCINDINLNKSRVNAGVRFSVWIDEEKYGAEEIVGDGLVVSTPFGSTAYYRSITNSTFRVGIGLAFNNTTEPVNHLVLNDKSIILVRVTRGPALLAADNNPDVLRLRKDDEIVIRRADHNAIVLSYDRVKYETDQFIFHESPRPEAVF